MEIKFSCTNCGQHLSAEESQARLSVNCPKCGAALIIPNAVPAETPLPPQPPPLPLPKPPTTNGHQPQPTRRHSIFYYVFWGTASLIGTLAILFLAFFFLTASGAGFLKALTNRVTVSVRNMPALTEAEAQEAKRLMGDLHVKKDNIEGITWYSPYDGYKTAVYFYIGKKDTGKPTLRWKILYHGEHWLFIRNYRTKIDQDDAKTLLPTEQIKRYNSSGSVWEAFDEPAIIHAHLLNQILASKTTLLRMDGTEGNEDTELSSDQHAPEVGGGTAPADARCFFGISLSGGRMAIRLNHPRKGGQLSIENFASSSGFVLQASV